MSALIWVQTVLKSYQQGVIAGKELKAMRYVLLRHVLPDLQIGVRN